MGVPYTTLPNRVLCTQFPTMKRPRPSSKATHKKPSHPKESGFLPWRVLGKPEERLHAAVNKLPMILFALDESGMITLSEGRGLKALKFKPGQLIGMSVYELYRNRPDIIENVKRALAGESFTAVSTIDEVVLETQFTPLHDMQGHFMGTIGVAIDITERKRAEDALRQHRQEQQIILDSAPAMIWYKDRENRILRCNKAAAESLGLTPDKVEGRSTYDLYPEHAKKYHEDDLEVIKSGRQKIGIIEEYILGDGEKRWVRTDKVPYRDQSGTIIGVIVFALDITERKRAEEELSRTSSELQGIFQALPDLYFRLGADGTILDYKTEEVADLYVSPEEFLGRKMQDVLPEDVGRQFAKGIEKVLKLRSMISFEYALNTKGGRQNFEARLSPLPNKQVIVIVRNITKRKQAEEAVRENEKRFRDIIEHSKELFYTHTPDHILTYVSPQARFFLGCDPEEAMVRWTEFVTDNPVNKQAMENTERAIRTGKPQPVYPVELITRDGRKIWVEVDEAPIVQDGKTVAIVGAIRDVTEARRTREALENQRAFFRQVIDMNPNFVFAKDREGRFTLVNQAVAEAYGMPVDKLVGKSDAEVNSNPQEVEHFRQDDLEVMDSRREKFISEEVITDATGKKRWLQTIKRPLADSHGEVNQVLGVATDITERKRAEEALRESEERYRLMFENNPMPMFVYEVDTLMFLSVNEAAIRHYGYTRQEFLKMNIKEIRPAEDVPLLMRILSENPDQSRMYGPIRHKKKDGSVIEVEISSHRINFAGRAARVVMVNDVTERKKAEQALLHSQKLESLGILAGGIAHDFNNLLMGVLGNSDLALQKLEPGSRLEVHLQQIKNASMRAAELCRQLLAYSGKGRFDVSFLDLNAMIRELTTLLKLSIHKGVTLNLCLENNLPNLLGDKVQIQQVIMNLVINSSEAIGDREGSITVTTKQIHADRGYLAFTHVTPDLPEGDYLLFEVRDTGCGMDSETLPRIFDPFFTTKFTGRGLGLAAVLGIVKGHGGALKVESVRGEGTTFRILFPSHAGEKPSAVRSSDPAKSENDGWLGRGTVLVVDDEEAVRAVSELILPTIGFATLVAADGFQACELLHRHREDIVAVLLDLTMPKMDGVKAVQELRKIKPGIKVLLMSGYDEDEAVNRFTNEGFDCFLQKPFVRGQLRDKLRSMLET